MRWAIAALCWFGCASHDDALAASRSAILAGARDDHRAGVVAVELSAGDASELCTGFLITADLVLTARHCVSALDQADGGCSAAAPRAPYPASAITVIPDTEITMNPTRWAVAAIVTLPDSDGEPICGADLALLRLATPTNPVGAIALRVDAPPIAGEVFAAVGYGATAGGPDTTSGTRRAREGLTVASVGASTRTHQNEWIASEGPCAGDSGSPAIVGGHAVGVMSRGSKATCKSMIYERLDVHADWLRASARASATRLGVPAPAWAALPEAPREAAPEAAPVARGCSHAGANGDGPLLLVIAGIAASCRSSARRRDRTCSG